jgi:hypothetical protein
MARVEAVSPSSVTASWGPIVITNLPLVVPLLCLNQRKSKREHGHAISEGRFHLFPAGRLARQATKPGQWQHKAEAATASA